MASILVCVKGTINRPDKMDTITSTASTILAIDRGKYKSVACVHGEDVHHHT